MIIITFNLCANKCTQGSLSQCLVCWGKPSSMCACRPYIYACNVKCSSAVSELQGTHIFLVVVCEGKFSLWQHKLPLQKLCVLFSFLPQHPFIETWNQSKRSTGSQVLQNTRVSLKMSMFRSNVLQRVTVFTSWLFHCAKNRFVLAQFCMHMRNNIVHISFTTNW